MRFWRTAGGLHRILAHAKGTVMRHGAPGACCRGRCISPGSRQRCLAHCMASKMGMRARCKLSNGIGGVLFLLLTILLTGESKSPITDHKTLLTIKREWGNPPLSSWNSTSTDYCSWTGVSCVAGRGVTGLSFNNLNLTGSVPASVCSLRGLMHLDLSLNNLTGAFPGAALYPCTKLQSLNLSYNAFDGVLPDDINRLSPLLTEFNLSTNNFSGLLPTAVGELGALKSLLFDTNKFTGQIPQSFSSLKELTMLDMSDNELSGAISIWIWQHPKLQMLYLSGNELAGELPSNITVVNLVEIDLSSNKLNGTIPEAFGTLKKLTKLVLHSNQFSGTIPTNIGLLPNLQYIGLFDNMLSGELPPELGKHSPLASLEVPNNHLSGSLPDQLCANGKLFSIVVLNNSFSGEIPVSISNCLSLDNIMLSSNNFSGEFPARIWSLPLLSRVMISKNSFTGALPLEIPLNITRIEMGENNFSGSFPASADGLVVFMAESNRLTGELPSNMSRLGNLTDVSVAGNNISGSIPTAIASLEKLNSLNLSDNSITGVIPPLSFGLLPSLLILDLSGNELSGGIPLDFNNLNFGTLNLSCNNLTGEVPPSLQIEEYDRSFLGNSGLCAKQGMKVSLPTCGHVSGGGGHNEKSSTRLRIVLLIICIMVTLIIGIIIGIVCDRWMFPWLRRWKDNHVGASQILWFSHLNFSESDIVENIQENNIIGTGGYGKVYRMLLTSPSSDQETTVAVKKIGNEHKSGEIPDGEFDRQFQAEAKVLGNIRHKNIVMLLGYISRHDGKLLIYEYMEKGSLDSLLHHGEPEGEGAPVPLDWPTRLAIAMDVARGLSHMHNDHVQVILHRDIKSANILLDSDFRAKIADFGLARMLVKSDESESTSTIRGTHAYMAPEAYTFKRASTKIDVYSFGVVMLELTTGKIASKFGAQMSMVAWARNQFREGRPMHHVVDRHIPDRDSNLPAILSVFRLGVSCTKENPQHRPTMKDVLYQLERGSYMDISTPAIHSALPSNLDIAMLAVCPKGKSF